MAKKLTPEMFRDEAKKWLEGTMLGHVFAEISLSTDEKGFVHEYIIENIKKAFKVGVKLAPHPVVKTKFQNFLDFLNSESKEENRFGMRLSQLNFEIFKKVVIVYERVTGGRGIPFIHEGTVERINRDLNDSNASGWTFGSRLSFHSKLWVRRVCKIKEENNIDQVVEFEFAGNTDKPERKNEENEMSEKFNDATRSLLIEEGVGIEIIKERKEG